VGVVAVAVLIIAVMLRDPALVRGDRMPTAAEMVVAAVPFVAIAAWLAWLGAVL
jgi:hypothetical protein